jgi:hypothetical protein
MHNLLVVSMCESVSVRHEPDRVCGQRSSAPLGWLRVNFTESERRRIVDIKGGQFDVSCCVVSVSGEKPT